LNAILELLHLCSRLAYSDPYHINSHGTRHLRYRGIYARTDDRMESPFRRPLKALKLVTMPLARRALFRHGVAAAIEHRVVLSDSQISLVVDVGAHRGQFSLAARLYCPQAQIIAFEPLPGPAAIFRRVFAQDRLTTLHQCAIGTQNGPAMMQVSKHDDSSSLLRITELQTQIFSGTDVDHVESVAVGRLTDYVSPADLQVPSLLKIDVQGFELEVLKSAVPLLPYFTRICIEGSFVHLYEGQALAHEIIGFISSFGFRLTTFYFPRIRPGTDVVLQGDMLFEKIAP